MQIFKQSDTQVYECIHCIGTAVNYTFKKLSKVKFLNHSLYLKKKKSHSFNSYVNREQGQANTLHIFLFITYPPTGICVTKYTPIPLVRWP